MKIKHTTSFANFARALAVVAAAGSLAGCSAGSGTASLSNPTGSIISATSGGTVTDSGVASIAIGPGALSQDAIVSIAAFSGTLPTAPSGLTLVPGTDVTFSDDGVTLNLPATVTIDYTTTNLGSLSATSLQLYQDVGGSWELVTGDTLSTTNQNVVLSTESLGTYALFAS